jgi:predicted dehydrogenase
VADVDEIRVACFGTNGHQVLSLLGRLPRARLVGCADVPEATLDELRAESPGACAGARHYPGLDELLAEAGADMVSICSARRDRQHEDVVRALEAGCHVYAEKPLATTMEGLGLIRDAAERSSREVRAMTGFCYNPTLREVRRLVAEGELGDVVQIFAQKSYPCHDRRPQDEGVDGGLLMQAGIHAVSAVRFVTGLAFEEVRAAQTRTGNPGGGGLRMAAGITIRLSGGALATVLANYCNPKGIGFWGNDQIRVFGTRGMAEAVDGMRRASVALGDAPPEPLPVADSDGGGYKGLFEDYVDHLLDGSDMLLSQEDCYDDTALVVRAKESTAGDGWVKV